VKSKNKTLLFSPTPGNVVVAIRVYSNYRQVRYLFLGSTTRSNSMRMIVVRKAEPGTIKKT